MSIIGLKKANCKNCYKCVKACPVKSIKVEREQAQIIDTNCILCGKCLSECPQNAKTLRSDIDKVKGFLQAGNKVIISLAPSYAGCFNYKAPGQLAGALKQLGFSGVSETAEGAAYVTNEYYELLQKNKMNNIITTCCPTVNNLIEYYFPDLIDCMAPVVSPMIAHARVLKQSIGNNIRVVFAGPCISKIAEAEDIRHDTEIDAVLTFDDLAKWFSEENIVIADCKEESFLNADSKILKMYPVTDGILQSLHKRGNVKNYHLISVDGVEECKELLYSIRNGEINHCFIEVNACKGGCVNGPAKAREVMTRFVSKIKVEKYAHENSQIYPVLSESPALSKKFFDRSDPAPIPDEVTIRKILAKIGKETPEQELNCGFCGYTSCREKAIAVYQNRAELTMCMPYMKERAESLSNYVMSETPNITIMVDEDMNIIEFNSAAEACFKISRREALKKCLYELIDVSDFQFVFDTQQSITDKKVHYREYNVTTMQNLIYIDKENIVMGIFRDVTKEEKEEENKYKLRVETMEMAQKVIDKQMIAAQQIASLLGETTAETKVTLTKLKNMIVFDGDEQ